MAVLSALKCYVPPTRRSACPIRLLRSLGTHSRLCVPAITNEPRRYIPQLAMPDVIVDSQPKFAHASALRAAVQTPFERNVLPDFASWLGDLIGSTNPDVLMPVETKGARLVDAALAYMDEHLHLPDIPVRLRRSLDYTAPEDLLDRRVLVVDDATHSGNTLNRYRKRIEDCCPGATPILAACFGALAPDGARRSRVRDTISCFREYLPDAYRENAWELTELVVARGLPPEVDHHMLRVPARIPLAREWAAILDRLAPFGVIDDFGAVSADGLLYAATLHWPTFAPSELLVSDGPIRREGVVKVRLFADTLANELVIIPLAYLEVEVGRRGSQPFLTPSEATTIFADWAGETRAAGVGRLLLERASRTARMSDVLYNAVCTTVEVKLIRETLAALHDVVGVNDMRFDERHFERLYGPSVAPALLSAITEAVNEEDSADSDIEPLRPHEPLQRVSDRCDCVVRHLKRGFERQNRGRSESDFEPYMLSFSELASAPECASAADPLTLSRCLDYALSIGSVVPATFHRADGNGMLLRRQYRTAEQTHEDELGFHDLESHREDIASETIAATTLYLSRRTETWRERGVPLDTLSNVVAVLRAAFTEMQQMAITVVPGVQAPEIVVLVSRYAGPDDEVRLRHVQSAHFQITADGEIEPTPAFVDLYSRGDLLIGRRRLLSQLEGYLGTLAPALDEIDVESSLAPWAMVASSRLGLDHVMHNVDLAVAKLNDVGHVLARGLELESGWLVDAVDESRRLLTGAREVKLPSLTPDWHSMLHTLWSEPTSIERELYETAQAAVGYDGELYSVVGAFCDVIARFLDELSLVKLADSSASLSDQEAIGRDALETIAEVKTLLSSMRSPGYEAVPSPPGGELARRLGSELSDLCRMLQRFIAAYAWRQHRAGSDGSMRLGRRPRTRASVILSADLTKSTQRSATVDHETYRLWIADGLSLIAEWAKAFGAREVPERVPEGDDIILEFLDADGAALAAALVNEHFRALRAIGQDRLSYDLRCAVDEGEVSPSYGGGLVSRAFNVATKLAKTGPPNRLLLTPRMYDSCSSDLRAFLSKEPSHVDLADGAEAGRFVPLLADSQAILRAYVARLNAWRRP
jgi:hypothetical protein